MLEYIDLGRRDVPQSAGTDINGERKGEGSWSNEASGNRSPEDVARLVAQLESLLQAKYPIEKRIALLKELKPVVTNVSARPSKPVVTARQPGPGAEMSQTLEQRLGILMVKNLQSAIKEIGRSRVSAKRVSTRLRLWVTTSLFQALGGLIEYAVRWNKPYPTNVWRSLHELYFYFHSRVELTDALDRYGAESGFDPDIAYKRLLLLGVAQRQASVVDLVPRLFDMLTRLAEESRLERPETYSGSFGLFVVENSRDEPPYLSSVIETGLRGWVFNPSPEFLRLIDMGY
jgi:hypothetical protein